MLDVIIAQCRSLVGAAWSTVPIPQRLGLGEEAWVDTEVWGSKVSDVFLGPEYEGLGLARYCLGRGFELVDMTVIEMCGDDVLYSMSVDAVAYYIGSYLLHMLEILESAVPDEPVCCGAQIDALLSELCRARFAEVLRRMSEQQKFALGTSIGLILHYGQALDIDTSTAIELSRVVCSTLGTDEFSGEE